MAGNVRRKSDLRIDQRPLIQALESRYPQLTPSDRERVAELIFKEVVKGLRSGKTLAFLEINPDGSVEISAFLVEKALARVPSGRSGRGR